MLVGTCTCTCTHMQSYDYTIYMYMYTYLKADPVSVVLMSIPPLVPLSPTVVHVHFTSTQEQRNSLHERREESQRESKHTYMYMKG